MRTTKKLTAAAVLAVGLLFSLALPASAAHVSIEVTGGSLTTALGTFDLTPGSQGESPCAEEPPAGDVTLVTDGVTEEGTWSVTGGYKGRFRLGDPPSGPWFQADFTFLAGSGGTYAKVDEGPPPVYDLQGIVVVRVDIYLLTPPGCEKDNLVCTVTGVFTITNGSFTGHLPSPPPGSTALIDADTVTTGFPLSTSNCGGAFAGLNGTDASLHGLHLTVL